MRRAFQARLLSVDRNARWVERVSVVRIGGFERQSYKLRYHLTLRMKTGQRRVLILRGSAEAQDETRRQAYVIMKYLWLHGFDQGLNQIARPITFFWRWKLLIYAEVPGPTLAVVLRRVPQNAPRLLNRTAVWLAALHQRSPRNIRLGYNQSGRKRYWQMALSALPLEHLPSAMSIRQGIASVMAFEDRLARQRYRILAHHDFHPGNVLVAPRTIRVVDFTESRLSDPLVDLATFIAQLDFQFRQSPVASRIDAWQKIFLHAYQRASSRPVHWSSARSQRIYHFLRYRIALQTFLGSYLFSQPPGELAQSILSTPW